MNLSDSFCFLSPYSPGQGPQGQQVPVQVLKGIGVNIPPNIPHLTTADAGAARGMWFAQGWAASLLPQAVSHGLPQSWGNAALTKHCGFILEF